MSKHEKTSEVGYGAGERPFAVCGIGERGIRWARECRESENRLALVRAEDELTESEQANTVIFMLFADLTEPQEKAACWKAAEKLSGIGATVLAFVAGDIDYLQEFPGLLTIVPMATEPDGRPPLAVLFACEIAIMALEKEVVCVDPVDVDVVVRGAKRAMLCSGQTTRDEGDARMAVERALDHAAERHPLAKAKRVLVRLLSATEPSLAAFAAADDALDAAGICSFRVVGLRMDARLSAGEVKALVFLAST